jgi:hypothetical protein
MTPTPRTDAHMQANTGNGRQYVSANFARQLERENAELLAALELISTHGHAEECLLLNRANEACDCGLANAYLVIAKTKGKP